MVQYTYEDFRDAREAVIRLQATDEAYRVLEQFGWRELFPGCVYKKEEIMESTIARQIITQAKEDETYQAAVPEDDATCIKEAENLVQMAEQAWAQNIRGPEVEAILKLAAGSQSDEGEEEPTEAEYHSGSEENGEEVETTSEIEDLTGIQESFTKMEPWEAYNEDRVKDITESINFLLEEKPDDLQDILTHVYAYEQSHKRRARIINHLKEAFSRIGVSVGESKQEEKEAESAERESSDDTDTERSSDSETQQSDEIESRATEEPTEAADASAPSVTKAPESSKEDRPSQDEAKPSEEDRGSPYQSLIQRVENDLRNERLDIPKPPQEKASEIPWRWNDISDGDLRDMHMQFASLAYYKQYVFTRDERIALLCKEAADELRQTLMMAVDKYDDHNKEKKVSLVEAEVESDENVRRWRRLQKKHELFAQAARRELDSYHKMVESISRLETMRHNAWERARR